MAGSFINRLGTSPEEGIKSPVVATTTENCDLSGAVDVDCFPAQVGQRVLVRLQDDPAENGIYTVSSSAWERTTDFNAADDVVNGVLVLDAQTSLVYQASFMGEWQPGVTEVTFIPILAGDQSVELFVPLEGTTVARPMTGSIQMVSTMSQDWRLGPVQALGAFVIADNKRDGNAQLIFQVNNLNTTIDDSGQVRVSTTYDASTPGNTLVTKQYVEDAVGSPTGQFIPITGAPVEEPVTGFINFEDSDIGVSAGIGIVQLGFDQLVISSEGMALTTGPSLQTQTWALNTDGTLQLPDIDYTAVGPLDAVNKAYVDSVSSPGEEGAYIPLAGTTTGTGPVTGVIEHENVARNLKFAVGISGLPGFEDTFLIAANASASQNSAIAFATSNAAYLFTMSEDGRFISPQVWTDTVVTDGLLCSGGADFSGDVTINAADLSVEGTVTCDNILTNGLVDTGGASFGGEVTVTAGGMDVTGTADFVDVNVTNSLIANGVICNGFSSVGGASFGGEVTITAGGIDVTGRADFSDAVIAMNLLQTNSQEEQGGNVVRWDYWNSNTVKTTGSQTISGAKTFTSSVSLSGTSLPLAIPNLQSASTGNFVRWAPSGPLAGVVGQSSTVSLAEVEGLTDKLRAIFSGVADALNANPNQRAAIQALLSSELG